MKAIDPVSLALFFALLGIVPLLVIVSTAFLKISVVIMLVRNALGVQQVPPNIAVYGLTLALTLYVMAPVVNQATQSIKERGASLESTSGLIDAIGAGAEPFRAFMQKHSKSEQRAFFLTQAKQLWPAAEAEKAKESDFLILMPSFVCSELTSAFEIGFLLYLPFVVIDLIVSNILLALGMMMVSPMTISLPLKLFLFVVVDGWTRLLQGLVLSYV